MIVYNDKHLETSYIWLNVIMNWSLFILFRVEDFLKHLKCFKKENLELKYEGVFSKSFLCDDSIRNIKNYCQRIGIIQHSSDKYSRTVAKIQDLEIFLNESEKNKLTELLKELDGYLIKPKRSPKLQCIYEKIETYSEINNFEDGQDICHEDNLFSGIKIFIYLRKTNHENGAFQYAKGTSNLTLKRIKLQNILFQNVHNNINKMPDLDFQKKIENEGFVVSSISGQKGHLIVFNTNGFHRRGKFLKNTCREVLVISFKESLIHLLVTKYLRKKNDRHN